MNGTETHWLLRQAWRHGADGFADSHSLPRLATFVAVVLAVRGLWVAVYRLYLHPLANFPGPKLASLSVLYEAYYDLVSKGGGQFAFQIKRLHEKYGPIVRIGPNEVHIDDPDFYPHVYTKHTAERPVDKLEKYKHRFGMPEALISTVEGEKHRVRRAAVAPFFSRARISTLGDTLQDVVERISHRLAAEYAGTGRVIDVCAMWGALTADVVSELAFARRTRFSDAPDFRSPYLDAMTSWVYAAHYTTHFNWIIQTMHWLPDAVVGRLIPSLKPVLDYRQMIRRQVRDVLAGRNMDAKEASHATIFRDILDANLPPEELTELRLTQEAMSISGAGIETTMWTLSVATFHVLWNPVIEARLVAELVEAMPDPSQILAWPQLEKLPYLSAVITEALRLSFGSVQRLPRVSRRAAIQYGPWRIPAGAAVSMDAYHIHSNPAIFPAPDDFDPDRWLGDAKAKGADGDLHPLSHYLVSFARGSRVCLGQHLAMMDMYVALATLFRRHRLQLFETDRSDVDFQVDLVRPMPKWGSKGVRIIVKE